MIGILISPAFLLSFFTRKYLTPSTKEAKNMNMTIDINKSPLRKRNRQELYLRVGHAAYQRGEYRRAERAYKKGRRLNPNNPSFYRARGEFFEAIGNFGAAQRDFEAAENLG